MKKVTLSLDSSLKEIFTYEESRAAFDKFLPGMRTMAEKQPAALEIGRASCRERV